MPLEVPGFILVSEWALGHRTRQDMEQEGSWRNPELLSCSVQVILSLLHK